ncbi:MAG: DUF1795 domain-containing protein [Actinomycetota bacterium]|nr:DUF1795 domain-containing protein [Actinomycetota bacterium]
MFRANLVVTVEEVRAGTDVERYTDDALATQERSLAAFRLIDRAPATFATGEGTRTLGHHNVDGMAVTIEQWRLIAGGLGYTVTASSWTLDYADLADALFAAAESLRTAEENS